jgi:hypothetical protein
VGGGSRGVEYLPSTPRTLGLIPITGGKWGAGSFKIFIRNSIATCGEICNPSTREAEAGES